MEKIYGAYASAGRKYLTAFKFFKALPIDTCLLHLESIWTVFLDLLRRGSKEGQPTSGKHESRHQSFGACNPSLIFLRSWISY